MKGSLRLLKNLIALAIIGGLIFIFFRSCSGDDTPSVLVLEESPLHLESIREIAEVATISFKDEVVVDSVEYLKSTDEKISSSLKKMARLDFKNASSNFGIKRRLTLILKGEAKIGFDLSNKNYKVHQNSDTIWFHFPKAKILEINLNPQETEVFQENGVWHDYARRQLMNKAKLKIESNVRNAEILQKAEVSMKELIKKLMRDKRKLLIFYE